MNFQHHIQPPPTAPDTPLPDVGQLPAFHAAFGGVLQYQDASTGDAARLHSPARRMGRAARGRQRLDRASGRRRTRRDRA
ncbi:MAG: hypothetical protein HEQ37_09580 [Acidovorax sp.]|nr:hypothetical protein [Acidovorax sp.]